MTKEELFGLKIGKPDISIAQVVQDNWDRVAKPIDGLGAFEKLTARIGAILGDPELHIGKKAVLVMCGDNGIVAEGVSQSGQEVSSIVTRFMGENKTSVGKMAKINGVDVIVTDIGLAGDEEFPGVRNCKIRKGTRNFRREPAMTEDEVLAGIQVGMDTVKLAMEREYRLLGTGEMGIGNTTTSSAMAAALLECPVDQITGRGAGLDDEGLARKKRVIKEALEYYQLKWDEPLRILETVGGLDIAGLVGVFLGGAVYHIPIVMDGLISSVAALTAQRLCPGVRDYVIPSHMSREPAAARIMEELGVKPVLDAGLALGEGTGAVMMFALLDTAMTLYESSTTFGDIQVEQYERYE